LVRASIGVPEAGSGEGRRGRGPGEAKTAVRSPESEPDASLRHRDASFPGWGHCRKIITPLQEVPVPGGTMRGRSGRCWGLSDGPRLWHKMSLRPILWNEKKLAVLLWGVFIRERQRQAKKEAAVASGLSLGRKRPRRAKQQSLAATQHWHRGRGGARANSGAGAKNIAFVLDVAQWARSLDRHERADRPSGRFAPWASGCDRSLKQKGFCGLCPHPQKAGRPFEPMR